MLSLIVPKRAALSDASRLVRGFATAARASGCALVGGNLSAGMRWTISVTLVGEPCGAPLRRSGARVGDLVYVTGHLCRASRVGAVVEADRLPYSPALRRLPRSKRLELALGGGEDYELVFTVP